MIETIKVGKLFSPLENRVMPVQSAGGKIPESMMEREKSRDKTRGGGTDHGKSSGSQL